MEIYVFPDKITDIMPTIDQNLPDIFVKIEPHAKYYELYYDITIYIKNGEYYDTINFDTQSNRFGFRELKALFTRLTLLQKILKNAKEELKLLVNFIRECEHSGKPYISKLEQYLYEHGLNIYDNYVKDYDKIVNAFKTWINENKHILTLTKQELIKIKIKNGLREWYNSAKQIVATGITKTAEPYDLKVTKIAKIQFITGSNRINGIFELIDKTKNTLIAKVNYIITCKNRTQLYKHAHELNKCWDFSDIFLYFEEHGQIIKTELYNFNIKIDNTVFSYDVSENTLTAKGNITAKGIVKDSKALIINIIKSPDYLKKYTVYNYPSTVKIKDGEITISPLGHSKIYEIEVNGQIFRVFEEIIDKILYNAEKLTIDDIINIIQKQNVKVEDLEKIVNIAMTLGISCKIETVNVRIKGYSSYYKEKLHGITFKTPYDNKLIITIDGKVYEFVDDDLVHYICCYINHGETAKIINQDITEELNHYCSEILTKIIVLAKYPELWDSILKRQLIQS